MRGDGITKTRFPGPATPLTQDKKEGEVGKTGWLLVLGAGTTIM